MVFDERSRHQLYLRLEEALGADAASTLMEHLPPTGWADVATKRDLDTLEARLGLRFNALEARLDLRIDALEERLDLRLEAQEERFETLEERFDLRLEAQEGRFETLEHKLISAFRGELQSALTAQGRQLAIALAGTAGALSALSFAAARLTAG